MQSKENKEEKNRHLEHKKTILFLSSKVHQKGGLIKYKKYCQNHNLTNIDVFDVVYNKKIAKFVGELISFEVIIQL